ncbi:O-antigen polymerase [Thiothrix subterranea]|uniref:O-antigen polymerase n=1 Tax=Thiothrix subterranea TaxID=2735563 RepID=A0ABU0Y429_9GAMM|nr:O-antigen polymerase [Thiothrix subterranea]MDQ5767546.1 O-antigen polymerase [Thiothrix subterranea]
MDYFIEYVSSLNLPRIFVIFSLIFTLSLYLTKRIIINIFDPFLILILFISFSLTLTTIMLLDEMINLNEYVFLLLSVLSFFLGSLFSYKKHKKNKRESLLIFLRTNSRTGFYISCILWLILIVSSFIMYSIKGIPIFSDDPSNAKVTLYQSGFGFVRYLHMIFPPLIVGQLILYLIVQTEKFYFFKKINLAIMLILISTFFISIFGGSKGALFYILTALSLALFVIGTKNNKLYKKIYKSSIKLLFIAVIYVFSILYLTPNSKESLLVSLAIRFMAAGDAYYFYYGYNLSEIPQYSNLFIGDLFFYLIDPLLGMLGFKSHDYPLGSYVMHYATGYPLGEFGPNALLPIVADIYFKKYFAWLFMFFMGYFFTFLRFNIVLLLMKFKDIGLFIYIFLWSTASSLYSDIILFTSVLYIFLFFVLPIIIIIRLLLTTGIKYATTNNRCLQ